MSFDRLKNKFEEIAAKNYRDKPNDAWLRRKCGRLPSLSELVKSCSENCDYYADWWELIKLGTGIRMPCEFLDEVETTSLIQNVTRDVESNMLPEYVLFRTYDVHYANGAIKNLLAFDDPTFALFIHGLNVMLAIIQPNNLLYPMISTEPSGYENLVKMNMLWFLKSNEVFFRYEKQLLEPMVKTLQKANPRAYKSALINNIAPQALRIENYLARMRQICDALKLNKRTSAMLSDLDANLDKAPPHRSGKSFRLVNARGESHFLQPIDSFKDSRDFFPGMISYRDTRSAAEPNESNPRKPSGFVQKNPTQPCQSKR